MVEVNGTNVTTNEDKEEGELTGKMTAAELSLSKMNLVITGRDTDSVSILGNPISPGRLYCKTKSTLTTASVGAGTRNTFTLDSQVSAMEEQIILMEVHLKKVSMIL